MTSEISSRPSLARVVKFILNASYMQINPITSQIGRFSIMDTVYKNNAFSFMCQFVQISKCIHRHTHKHLHSTHLFSAGDVIVFTALNKQHQRHGRTWLSMKALTVSELDI